MLPARSRIAPCLLVLATDLAACGGGTAAALPPSAPTELLGQAIAFTLVSAQGEPTPVPVAGRVTLVDYFGPQCVPCREKLPALWAERQRLTAAGVELQLVAILDEGQSTEEAAGALAKWGVPGLPFLVDRDNVAAREAGLSELPGAQVYDRAGALRWQAPSAASVAQIVDAAMAVR